MLEADTLVIGANADLISKQDSAVVVPRFFEMKNHVDMHFIERPNYQNIPLWIHLSLFFWVVVAVFARQFYTLRLEQIFKSILSSSHLKQLHREGNLVKHGYPIILLFMFSFSLALFMFQLLGELYPHSFYFSVGQGFLLVLGATLAYFIGKFLTIWYLGILFQTKHDTYRYLTDQFLFQISASFVLLPLLILYIYSGYQLFVVAAIIVLSFLWAYRLQRAFVIGLACTNFSRSYLFLYLCTLEVLPLLILFKLGFQFV